MTKAQNTDSNDAHATAVQRNGHADERKEFPLHLPDRFEKRVREDHAPNQALHDVLRESDTIDQTDLMASHGPGEKPNGPRPTYHVWAEFRNDGGGHPVIRDPVRTLVDRDSVKLCGVVECSDDHLIVSLRAIERTVEPIMVTPSDLPRSLKESLGDA